MLLDIFHHNLKLLQYLYLYLLEKKDYDVEVFKNERRTEFGIEDHVFLYVDNHIVDPTFRQFMVDPRSKTSNCLYQHTLFNKFHPFMVCLPNEIPQFLQNILNVNKFCYSTAFKNYDYNTANSSSENLHIGPTPSATRGNMFFYHKYEES